MSSRPKRCAACRMKAAASASRSTCASTNTTSPPLAAISSATRLPRSASRSAKATFAPSFTNRRTVASPIPEAPPVTAATFPFSRAMLDALSLRAAIAAQPEPYGRRAPRSRDDGALDALTSPSKRPCLTSGGVANVDESRSDRRRARGGDRRRGSSRPLDDPTFAAIERAYNEYGVIFFRGQSITPAQQVAFTRRFGEIEFNIFGERWSVPGNPEIVVLSNVTEGGRPTGVRRAGERWHSDMCYTARPPRGTVLYATEVPELHVLSPADTEFASAAAAWDAMPDAMKRALEGRRAVLE